MKSKKFILYIVGMIILGALVARGYPNVGLWWTIFVLCFYSASGIWRNINVLRRFKKHPPTRVIRASLAVVIALLTITAIFTKHIPYFLVLAMLAIEYMYRDKNEQ